MAKAALVELGVIESAAVRLPLVESPPRAPRACCAPPSRRCTDTDEPPPPRARAARPPGRRWRARRPARRARRGRPQHDRLRAPRPAAGHRLRSALPRGPPARRRPDPARLRLHQGPARRRAGRRAHPRPRGPHRRRALPAAREARHPADRLEADAGAHRGQAPGAPHHALHAWRCARATASSSASSTASSSRSTTRSPTRWPSRSAPRRGLVLHTGDFKMDQLPLDGRLTDLRAFARLGEEGVDLFLADSTNAEVPGFTTPERDIAPAIDTVFRHAERRVIVACFASPRAPRPAGARRRGAGTAARSPSSAGRWCATWASPRDLGYLHVPDGRARRRQDSSTTCPTTRSCWSAPARQGEPMAALSRMANRDHRIRRRRGRHRAAGQRR